jgi:glutathione synthase/RimK-type ligase-like ATP-grasp enzyme
MVEVHKAKNEIGIRIPTNSRRCGSKHKKEKDMGYVGLYTQPNDSHLERILAALRLRKIPFVCFDRAKFPQQLQLEARLNPDTQTQSWYGSLFYEQQRYYLDEMRSILYRRPSPSYRLIDGLSSEESNFAQEEAKRGFDGVLRSLPCLWVNHPDALAATEWKPRQLALANQLGFRIPRTLITNDPAEALRFFEECEGRVIYKPLSASPTIQTDSNTDNWSTIYTTRLTKSILHQFAPHIAHTAHLFQEEIPKAFELRVTIFGTHVFATALYSQRSERTRIDWRRGYDELEYGIYTLPENVRSLCLELLAHLHLHFAALDLAVTPDGEYIFFESNCNGQWMWIETVTGQPLTEAMVDLLSDRIR